MSTTQDEPQITAIVGTTRTTPVCQTQIEEPRRLPRRCPQWPTHLVTLDDPVQEFRVCEEHATYMQRNWDTVLGVRPL